MDRNSELIDYIRPSSFQLGVNIYLQEVGSQLNYHGVSNRSGPEQGGGSRGGSTGS